MKSLQVLSNCSGIPIKEQGLVISGAKVRTIKIAKGVSIKLSGEIVSGFKTDNQAGILIKMKGHLYITILYSGIRRTVSIWIIDSTLLGLDEEGMVGLLDGANTLRLASDIIRLGVVQSYYSEISSHNGVDDWKELTIPKG